jgi:hypothetical protein
MPKESYNYTFPVKGPEKELPKVDSKSIGAIEEKETIPTFFTVRSETCSGFKAVFGFNLISINKQETISERYFGKENEDSLNKTLLWHKTFFKTLQDYGEEIQINLKYITEDSKLKFKVIFSVYSQNNYGLERMLENFQTDVSAFFTTKTIDKTNPYIFEQINDEDILNDCNKLQEYSTSVFYREPIKIKRSSFIGFNQSHDVIPHDSFFPMPFQHEYNNELIKALSLQRNYVEIDIQLSPKELDPGEINSVKNVLGNQSLINISSIEERIKYINYLEKLISDPKIFMAKVFLKSKKVFLNQHLLTSVVSYFFGDGDKLNNLQYDEYFSNNSDRSSFSIYYNIDDVTQVFRLPLPDNNSIPGVQQQPGIFYFLPENAGSEGILLGEKKIDTKKNEIKISFGGLQKHLYIIGQTGTGKSTLLKTMIKDCLKNNYGLTLIDPHGDLFDDVYNLIPDEKLLIIDPLTINTLGINLLYYDKSSPQSKSLIINELIRIFSSLYDMKVAGGPMFESYFKQGLLLIMDQKVEERFGELNLRDFVKLFFSPQFRDELLKECSDESVVDFFDAAEQATGEQRFDNWTIYITSKLNRFIDDYYLAPLLSGLRKNVNFRELIDEGKILLVKMEKGLIGNDNISLLGQIVLSNIVLAGMSRTRIKPSERKQHYIFIDEFQNFVKSDIGSALSEVRKYGLNLILANQTLGQLDDFLIQSLLGNVGSMIFFRPGINDYEKIKHYIEPHFQKEDVLRLPNFSCIGRLMINNIPSEPFVFQTIK